MRFNSPRFAVSAVVIVVAASVAGLVYWQNGGRLPQLSGQHSKAAEATSAGSSASAGAEAAKQAASRPTVEGVTLDPPPKLETESPLKDGWPTELLTEQLTERLKQLGKAIARQEVGAIESLLAADASLLGLPRAPAVAVQMGGLVQVRRQAPGAAKVAGKKLVAGQLAGLGRGTVAGEPYLKFQLDGIHVADMVATIHARVTTYWPARCETAKCPRAERHDEWQMRWQLDDAKHAHLLLSAELGEASSATAAAGALFEDVTGAVLANVAAQSTMLADADTWLKRMEHHYASDPIGHQGLAIGDVNGDGLDDLYLCAPSGVPNRLLIQQANGTVVDTALKAGVAVLDLSRSALFADLDNDGDQDLLVATRTSESPKDTALLLFEGDGRGQFASAVSVVDGGDVHSLAAADFDQDGDLDLYACLLNADRRIAGGLGVPAPYHNARNGGRNLLLANEGKLKFRDVTAAVGLDKGNTRWSYAAAWEDYDNDGDMDIYVANNYGENNLYRNDNGKFVDVTGQAGVADLASGMSVSWGDVDRDGDMDLYVGNTYSSAGRRIVPQRRFKKDTDDETRSQFLRHARGNTLFRNNGDGTFTDIADTAGATVAGWAWGSMMADFDGDGWHDVLAVNGMLTRSDEHDLRSFYWRQVVSQSPISNKVGPHTGAYGKAWVQIGTRVVSGRSWSGRERHRVFLNTRDGRFADSSYAAGVDLAEDGRGLALVDWDHDGDLDAWISSRSAPRLRLLRNRSEVAGRSIAVSLRGVTANRDGVGARVTVHLQGDKPLIATLRAGEGFLSQSSKTLVFGLGASKLERVVVRWPGGAAETFVGVVAGGRFLLQQAAGQAEPMTPRQPAVLPPAPMKIDRTDGPSATFLAQPMPFPLVKYTNFVGKEQSLAPRKGRSTLVVLWSRWCAPCLKEFKELGRQAAELEGHGVDVVALNVDRVSALEAGDRKDVSNEALAAVLLATGLKASSGALDDRNLAQIEMLYRWLFTWRGLMPLPVSFLIHGEASLLRALYRGPANLDRMVEDLANLSKDPKAWLARAAAGPGFYHGSATPVDLQRHASDYISHGHEDAGLRYLEAAVASGDKTAEALNAIGALHANRGRFDEARVRFEEVVALHPKHAEALSNLARILMQTGDVQRALKLLSEAVDLEPNKAAIVHAFGMALARAGRLPEAREQLMKARAMDPRLPVAQALEAIERDLRKQGLALD